MRIYKFGLIILFLSFLSFAIWKTYYKNNIKYLYFEDNTVSTIISYSPKDSIQCQKHFYHSGNLKKSACFKGQKLHGKGHTFFENGKDSTIATYENGIIIGEFMSFHQNGELKSKVNFEEGLKQGKQKHFHQSGKLKSIAYYKDDILYKLQMFKPDSVEIKSMLDTVAYWPIVNINKDSFNVNDTLIISSTFPANELKLSKNDSLIFRYSFTDDTTRLDATSFEEIINEKVIEQKFVIEDSGTSYLYGLITLIKDEKIHNFPVKFWEIKVL